MLLAHAELLALPLAFRDNHGTQHPAAPSPEPGQQQALSENKQVFWSKVHAVTLQYSVQWIFKHLD